LHKKHILGAGPTVFLLISGLSGQGSPSSLGSRIDELVHDYAARQNFMGSVLVADKGRVVLAKGYGLADVERNIANTPETRFMIGSITKQFTALLVTQPVEKGRLSLDETVSDFLPEFPKDIGDRITAIQPSRICSNSAGRSQPTGCCPKALGTCS
jgi:CubicO group peptidase (beta-lactamase class C family)